MVEMSFRACAARCYCRTNTQNKQRNKENGFKTYVRNGNTQEGAHEMLSYTDRTICKTFCKIKAFCLGKF